MLYMLQVFQRHVASVCSKCFICFQTYVANVFDLDVVYVAASVLFWMFHVFHKDVARACSKCFICFQSYVAFMLQVFYVVRLGRARGRLTGAQGVGGFSMNLISLS